MSARAPGERWECEACGRPLVGARTKAGRVAPIEVDPEGDGNVVLHRLEGGEVAAWVLGGETIVKARDSGVRLRRNHFQGCPQAARFRP